MQARAAILRQDDTTFHIEDVEIGPLNDDEVLVEMVGAGICHTDELFRSDVYPFPRPCILGHEGSGRVIETGSAVGGLEAGDHVVLSVMFCGHCRRCQEGQHYICENIYEANFGGRGDGTNAFSHNGECIHAHFDGQSSFSTVAVSNVRNTIKVRKDAPLEILGPLGCGFRTGLGALINTFDPKAGESIVVYGAGSVGLSAMLAANLMGCHPIIAVDPNEARRNAARDIGASHVFDSAEEDLPARIIALTGGGTRYALDTTGIPAVIRDALESTGVAGFLGILGGSPLGTELVLDANHILFGSRRIQGIQMGDAVGATFIPNMVELMMAGKLPLEKLVTRYPFDQINQAFEDTKAGKCVKAVLTFD
ncbi:MAG: NAD(P)-dependent alcohol dehydrogenase [Boseongicola sp. SB0664_bin_43]|uniref:NAD(P)-dependent alcohol dehydrogenase n=1 Tax=Boseongicola sp. SB0664_bin_43 TaxID=2604844 RepID=A0A6B0Y2Y2_9RHOB|nr:NAD(P)-dependent alcohol dehydrogenase [Boseongicola sp. SB0664_bin_43]